MVQGRRLDSRGSRPEFVSSSYGHILPQGGHLEFYPCGVVGGKTSLDISARIFFAVFYINLTADTSSDILCT